jgi:hypothetical protein
MDGTGLNPSFLAQYGITPPTSEAGGWILPANKYGLGDPGEDNYARFSGGRGWAGGTYGLFTGFGGCATDTGRYSGNLSSYINGGGDSHLGLNFLWRCVIGADLPYTEIVVTGVNVSNMKRCGPTITDQIGAGDSADPTTHYDGTPKGGHRYHGKKFLEGRNLFTIWGYSNSWPTDRGNNDKRVRYASLTTGAWSTTDLTPLNPFEMKTDEIYWTQKHKYTEDMFQIGVQKLVVWRNKTNTWQNLFSFPNVNADYSPGIGGIDEDNDYILFWSTVSGGGPAANFWWTVSGLNTGAAQVLYNGAPSMTGPCSDMRAIAVANGTTERYFGMCRCPDRNTGGLYPGSFLVYICANAGAIPTPTTQPTVYEIIRTGANTFSSALLSPTGPGSTSSQHSHGGVGGSWQYFPQLKGMVIQDQENVPMWYLRTAT